MQKDKFKVFISDWNIPTNSILALVYKGNLFVIDEFSVESSPAAKCFKLSKSTDRYVVIHHKLEYCRYSMNGFELMVDGKVRDDVLWFSIKKKRNNYFIDSPYPFVNSIGFATCLFLFFMNVVTLGFFSVFLISWYRRSLVRSSRILRIMQGRVFEMATGHPAYKKLEEAPSVVTSKEFDMEMNFQDYLAKTPKNEDSKTEESAPEQPQEPELEEKEKETDSSKSDPITLVQSAFSESPITPFDSSSTSSSFASDSVSLNVEPSISTPETDSSYSVSESSLPVSSLSDAVAPEQEVSPEAEVKSTVKKRVTRRKKSSV